MAINAFDDIPDLRCYWSAVESEITKAADVVSEVNAAGGAAPVNLTQSGTGQITHNDSTIKINNCPAFHGGRTDVKLFVGNANDVNIEPMTVFCLSQYDDAADGGNDIQITRPSRSSYLEITERNGNITGKTNNIRWQESVVRTLNPVVIVATWDSAAGGTGNFKMWVDGVEVRTDQDAGTTAHTNVHEVSILNNMGGKLAIAGYYNRYLSDEELGDLSTLLAYWRDNGEAPSTGPSPSATFGPVTTNDDTSVTGWQWEASTDGGSNWDNAENVMSDVSGQTTTTLTVNSARTDEDQTQVRCRATSVAVPAGVVSHTATLTVVSE